MIKILKKTDRGLDQLTEMIPGCWVHAINPTPEEIAQLEHETGAPIDFITPALDIDESARTDKENGVTLIVLRIPYFQGADADVPYTTMPLGIVLTEQHVMTVCRNENGVMHELLGGRVRGLSTAKRNRFVLHLLLIIAQKYLQYLRQINKAVDALEDQLQRSQKNRELLQLLQHQKSLVYFTTALKSNELVLQRLQRSRLFDMYPDDTDLLEDALTETQQAIEMTNISGNILSQMMDAFASIISNNLNVVMKFLASITIVLSIPTIVASFYGMNVDLPMQNHPLAFAITLAVALGIAFLVVIVFWRKDWF
jgi:magnesium transporter